MIALVLKYPIPVPGKDGLVTLHLPMHSRPLHFDFDGNGRLCLWAQVDVEAAHAFAQPNFDEARTYRFVNTGKEFTAKGEYTQTLIDRHSQQGIVWHIYQL